jgi:O-antigen/teichoic acid export membrane protein
VKKLLKNILRKKNVHSLLFQIVSAGLGFASFIILAQYLTKYDFGMWVLYFTAYGFLNMLRNGITHVAVVRTLSGANDLVKGKIIGSNWVLNFTFAAGMSILVLLSFFVFKNPIEQSGYYYFFKYFPILVIVNIPLLNAITLLQADQKFSILLLIRSFEGGLFVLFLLVNIYLWKFNIEKIIIIQLLIIGLTSFIIVIKGYDGIKYFRQANKEISRKILSFGKFSTGSFLGSNLLKSADTFIIGLSAFLGPNGVAVISIPLKFIEILEIPVRSFSLTLLPRLSKFSIENNMQKLKQLFYSHTGALTILFIPILIVCYIFADDIMTLLGGAEYHDTGIILRVYTIYGILLPIDRFTGIALDSINKPNKNFIKIMLMATANIIGDLIAVFLFKSLILVAVVTILFTLLGIIVGIYFLNKEIGIESKRILIEGFSFYKNVWNKVTDLLNKASK